jgi:hypothetical protein
VRGISAAPELVGGFEVHRSRLVWQSSLVGNKRALGEADGSVRIWCDVCESTYALGQQGDMLGNFKRSHLLKPAHQKAAAARRAAALSGAAPVNVDTSAWPAEALNDVGVRFLPAEAELAVLPAPARQTAARRAAALSAAAPVDVDAAAWPAPALAGGGVRSLRVETELAALPADDGAFYMVPQLQVVLRDLFAKGRRGPAESTARFARTIWGPRQTRAS